MEDPPSHHSNEPALAVTPAESMVETDIKHQSSTNQIHLDESEEEIEPTQLNEEEDRSHTFRQRRLTYTSHNLQSISAALLEGSDFDSDEDAAEGVSAGDSKRKLNDVDEVGSSDPKRSKSKSEHDDTHDPPSDNHDITGPDSSPTPNVLQPIKSRYLHASAPPKPKCPYRQCHMLYQHPPNVNDTLSSSHHGDHVSDNSSLLQDTAVSSHDHKEPEWKRTLTSNMMKESSLPFPMSTVGTYSCHGIEPVYEHVEFETFLRKGRNAAPPTAIAKINQDRGGIVFPYANRPQTALFAAYDGHGEGGELVSQFALHEIPKRLEAHEEFKKGNFETAFKDVFIDVNECLEGEPDIEPLYSGCTACVALVTDNEIYLSNAGDSRAVMASQVATGHKAIDLTVDQNPDSPGEKERIEKAGGFVSPPPEEGLSARVWLDSKFSQIGLAMGRSIGDYAVKKVGVIAEPVVTKYTMMKEDEFMIIATDGVWEFLSSQDAVDIVSKGFKNGVCSSVACQHLIEAAAAQWHEHEGDYRDDITALVIKVKELWKA